MVQSKHMNLLSFNKKFPSEESCRLHLKEMRERQGIVCKKCGCEKHYWFANMQLWKCAGCGARLSLRAGTLMEKSHLLIISDSNRSYAKLGEIVDTHIPMVVPIKGG